MKKISKSKNKTSVDPYLEGLMSKLLDRLVTIDRKVDTLIGQRAGKPSGGDQANPPVRKERTLYEAICADCHKVCEVPFRPSEARPVYCKECFAKRKSGGHAHGMPVLTSVSLPPRPVSKLGQPSVLPAGEKPKKANKTSSVKKGKKKK